MSRLLPALRQRIESVAIQRTGLSVRWADKHVSHFHHAWLRDHCGSRYHPSSGQRMLPLASIPLESPPLGLTIIDGLRGQTLQIQWPADESGASRMPQVSSFDALWLRQHCYSESERRRRAISGEAAAEGGTLPFVQVWGPEYFATAPLPHVAWHSVLSVESSANAGTVTAREDATLQALEALHKYGFVLVDGVSGSVEATRELAESIGLILPSIYGDIWDTGGELEMRYKTSEGEMIDTAYSNASLPLHTDCTYMNHPPGLQLFNCVAQSDIENDPFGPKAGCTKLADGMHVADILRKTSPEAFDFFSRTPIPFVHRAGDACLRSRARVFSVDQATGALSEVRYNETDRDVFHCLSEAEVPAFYSHVRALEEALDKSEMHFKLTPGVALILDNRRTLHGRVGFTGRRNLVGCYLTADDWRSNLRVKRARKLAIQEASVP